MRVALLFSVGNLLPHRIPHQLAKSKAPLDRHPLSWLIAQLAIYQALLSGSENLYPYEKGDEDAMQE